MSEATGNGIASARSSPGSRDQFHSHRHDRSDLVLVPRGRSGRPVEAAGGRHAARVRLDTTVITTVFGVTLRIIRMKRGTFSIVGMSCDGYERTVEDSRRHRWVSRAEADPEGDAVEVVVRVIRSRVRNHEPPRSDE